jgi:hypothetical protein
MTSHLMSLIRSFVELREDPPGYIDVGREDHRGEAEPAGVLLMGILLTEFCHGDSGGVELGDSRSSTLLLSDPDSLLSFDFDFLPGTLGLGYSPSPITEMRSGTISRRQQADYLAQSVRWFERSFDVDLGRIGWSEPL